MIKTKLKKSNGEKRWLMQLIRRMKKNASENL